MQPSLNMVILAMYIQPSHVYSCRTKWKRHQKILTIQSACSLTCVYTSFLPSHTIRRLIVQYMLLLLLFLLLLLRLWWLHVNMWIENENINKPLNVYRRPLSIDVGVICVFVLSARLFVRSIRIYRILFNTFSDSCSMDKLIQQPHHAYIPVLIYPNHLSSCKNSTKCWQLAI